MKTIYKYLILTLLFYSVFTSCKEMDSMYKEFVVPGGIIYTQKVTSPLVYPGRNRVKISWQKGSDPNVIKARIFWNNYSDSVEVNITPTDNIISTIIDNLPEKSYSFIIKTYDVKGNSSVPVELLSQVYGNQYQAALLNRPLNSLELDVQNRLIINWGDADISNGAFSTDIKYTDTSGKTQIRLFPVKESISIIPDNQPGSAIQIRTAFLPDSLSIDVFYTSYVENTLFLLNKSQWKVTAFSTQQSGVTNLATNIIDGNPGTRWQTLSTSSYPHSVTVDMGIERTVTNFEIFRMTGDELGCNTFQLLVSLDNKTWTDLGPFNFNRLIDNGQFYKIPSLPKARYFKFVGLTGPQKYMDMGEINVYGY
jgi:hypothetical protein